MPSTRCTCMRDAVSLRVVAYDPLCQAPTHLWDEIEDTDG